MGSKYEHPKPEEPQHIACEICQKEIPASAAHSAEGPDYVVHFCGIECLDFFKQKEQEEGQEKPDDIRPDV